MPYLNKTVICTILILLSSCSTTKFKNFFDGDETSSKRNENLLEDFKTEEVLLDKFKEKKVKPTNQKLKISKETKVKTKNETIKKNIKAAPKKKKVTKKIPVILPKKVEVKKTKKVSEIKKPKYYDFDQNSERFWSEYRPFLRQGEKTVLDITYMGVSTGKIYLTTEENKELGGQDVYHIKARVKTATFYSYLYEVDDLCDSYISTKNFVPVKFSLIQRESSQDIDDLQLFDHHEQKMYSFYKRVTKKKTKKKKKTKETPKYFQDPFSVMYFLRGLPLAKGREFDIPIVNKGKVEILSAKVYGKEVLNTEIGETEAYRIDVYTKSKGDTIKGGNMKIWFSADERRVFLKFKAKISIGSIHGEVSSYK